MSQGEQNSLHGANLRRAALIKKTHQTENPPKEKPSSNLHRGTTEKRNSRSEGSPVPTDIYNWDRKKQLPEKKKENSLPISHADGRIVLLLVPNKGPSHSPPA